MLIIDEEKLKQFYSSERKWQGIPGVERTKNKRLFVTFYSGGSTEELGNYCILIKSDDDGKNWTEPIAVAYNGENSRCYDPCLWIDPLNRLWFIWSIMPEHSVWASICDKPDDIELKWSEPKLIGHDIMMNKPTVLSSGEWLFPIAVWNEDVYVIKDITTKKELRRSFVYSTIDNGETFVCLGGSDVPDRSYDEHMVIELKDNTLLMLVRTKYGIGRSYSYDKGVTWTEGEDSGIKGPGSRFHIKRLVSGNILLINHYDFSGRNNLTAMISKDEGKTWEGFLTLDERSSVSYPDAVEGVDGYIYVVYDRERGATYDTSPTPSKEILMAKFTENDILSGKVVSADGVLKAIVNKL
jgi:predicted neuraminidase